MFNVRKFLTLQNMIANSRYSTPYAPKLGNGNKYHVAKTGSDSSVGSANFPFLTIDKAMHTVQPGDTVYVHAGSYSELSSFSLCAVTCYTAGLTDNPITVMAYPGDEGLVYIDGGGARMGVQTNNLSNLQFWGLRVRNCEVYGFNNWGQVGSEVPDVSILSKNVRIENCYVHDVVGDWGVNISGIGPWGSKDWIIRNTKIRNVSARPPSGGQNPTVTSAIQWYQAINLIVEHCDADSQYGISAKDHFLDSISPVRVPSKGVIACYNRLKTTHAGFRCSIRGGNTPEAGNQYMHHNLIYGLNNNAEGGIVGYMDGATGQSKRFALYSNTIDMTNAPSASIIEAQLLDQIECYGNVGVGGAVNLSIAAGHAPDYKTLMTLCDYNIYTAEQWILDRYGPSSVNYNSLAVVSALLSGSKETLGVSHPELHSLIASDTNALFVDRVAGNYRPKIASPLLSFMPDGTNAGCYQKGNEIIGLLPGYSAG